MGFDVALEEIVFVGDVDVRGWSGGGADICWDAGFVWRAGNG